MRRLKLVAIIAAPALLAGCFDAHLHGNIGQTDVNLALKGESEVKGITISPITKQEEDLCRQINIADGYLRIRNSSNHGEEIGRLYPGSQVEIVSSQGYGEFVEIISPQPGFVSARYLKSC